MPDPSGCWDRDGHRVMVIGKDWCRVCGFGRDEWLLAADPDDRRRAQRHCFYGAVLAWCVNVLVIAVPVIALIRWLFTK